MAELIGTLGSAGMIALIGALILLFLWQIGALRRDSVRAAIRICLWTACAGAGYVLFMLLCRRTVFLDQTQDVLRAMGGGYLRDALDGLEKPEFTRPLTGLMSWAGHGIGKVVFGQYRLGGFLLSFLCTAGAALLFYVRLKKLFGEQAAEDGCFLLLCDPCAVFFFFPCGVPLALLIVCGVFFLATRRAKPRTIRYSRSLYGWIQALSVCLSAAMACAVALGRIG